MKQTKVKVVVTGSFNAEKMEQEINSFLLGQCLQFNEFRMEHFSQPVVTFKQLSHIPIIMMMIFLLGKTHSIVGSRLQNR
jgi:hypothetical protein